MPVPTLRIVRCINSVIESSSRGCEFRAATSFPRSFARIQVVRNGCRQLQIGRPKRLQLLVEVVHRFSLCPIELEMVAPQSVGAVQASKLPCLRQAVGQGGQASDQGKN